MRTAIAAMVGADGAVWLTVRPMPLARTRSAVVLRPALLTDVAFALAAPAALAHDGGEGRYGETNDKVITNAGFILIAAFPLLILILSLIQWRLEKRKDRRKAAAKARARPRGPARRLVAASSHAPPRRP